MNIIAPIILSVFFLTFLCWLLYYLHKESKKISYKTYEDLNSDGFPKYKCPKCSNCMDIGFSIAGKGILFRNKDEDLKLMSTKYLLENTANFTFSIKENLSWKCNDCKLVILDHSCMIKKSN